MFDFVRNHQKLLQFILVLLIFPSFVFLGLEGYSSFGAGENVAARVGALKITQAEWDNAHRSTVEKLRQQDKELDLATLDTPAVRQQALDGLIRDRLMFLAVQDQHLSTTDERLTRLFQGSEDFAFLRRPDGTLNRELIEAQGMSVEQFEARLRQDLAMRQVLLGINASATGSRVAAEAALDALMQRREIRLARFEAARYREGIQPTEAEIEAHHQDPKNTEALEAPERTKFEYVMLDATQIAAGLQLPESEARAFYEANASRYSQPEERRASHILIKVDAKASAEQKAAAKAKAQDLLKQLRDAPKRFAELAKAHSEDSGSAAKGGDLDYFGRGMMVKPFEDLVFSMPVGAISEVLETEFGYHIIQATGQRGQGKRSFEEAREEIEGELRKQRAQKLYAEQAEAFSNLAYEQSDSLQSLVDKLGLKLQAGSLVGRNADKKAEGPLRDARFIAALFSDSVLKDKRNTEALELGPNQLVAARVVEHRPKRKLSLDEAREIVRSRVALDKAAALAKQEGEAKLAAWRAQPAEANAALGESLTVSRPDPKTLNQATLEAVLKAPVDKLPAFVGIDLGGDGYLVARIDRVLAREAQGDPKQLQAQYAQLWASVESAAYTEALKSRYKVKIEAKPASPKP